MTATGDASPLARADALLELGRPREALAVLRSALLAEPDDPFLLVRVADLLVDLNEGAQALEVARRAVAADPEWAWTFVVLARAYRCLGQHDRALRAAREAVWLDPELIAGHFERGLGALLLLDSTPGTRRQRGWLPEARESAERLEYLSPASGDGAALHAFASLLSGTSRDWGQFDTEIARALARDPGHDLAHNVRLLGLKRRRGLAAIPELHARLRVNPDDAFARSWLRQLLSGRGTVWSNAGVLAFGVGVLWLCIWAGGRLGGLGAFGALVGALGLGWGLRSLPVPLRYPDAYRAAYSARERGVRARAALSAALFGLGGVLVLGLAAFPLAFTPGTLFGLPLLALACLAVLARSVPAFLSGEGGFFGRRGEEARTRLVLRRPPEPRVVAGLKLAAVGVVAWFLLLMLRVFVSDLTTRFSRTGWGLSVLILVLLGALAILGAGFLHEVRHGERPRWRRSPLDGLAAGVALAVLLGTLAAVPGLPGAWREARPPVASPAGPLRSWAYGGALDFAVGFAPNDPPGVRHPCEHSGNNRLIVVQVPGGSGRWVLSSAGQSAREVPRLSACVRRVGLHPDPRLRVFARPPGPLRLVSR